MYKLSFYSCVKRREEEKSHNYIMFTEIMITSNTNKETIASDIN